LRRKLFLFDIDGTLVSPGPVSRMTLDGIIKDLLGRSPKLQYEDVAGSTDPIIVQTGLKRIGVVNNEINELTQKILSEYEKRLPEAFNNSDEPFAYEDAVMLLDNVINQGFAVGVLSGNMQAAAELKLGKFGLLEKFPFGIYADETDDRSAMPMIARERAWDAYNEAFRFKDMIIVGDTAADARAACENGCMSIIVCRRETTRNQAQEAGATYIVSSLAEIELDTIFNG
tara:strand:+ start:1803 stop:2489 length:687 start_codon:yes stop_codon:yes gene_type:complete